MRILLFALLLIPAAAAVLLPGRQACPCGRSSLLYRQLRELAGEQTRLEHPGGSPRHLDLPSIRAHSSGAWRLPGLRRRDPRERYRILPLELDVDCAMLPRPALYLHPETPGPGTPWVYLIHPDGRIYRRHQYPGGDPGTLPSPSELAYFWGRLDGQATSGLHWAR